VEVAKALGGSFKLVTLAPKTVREMCRYLSKQHIWLVRNIHEWSISRETIDWSTVIDTGNVCVGGHVT